MEKIIDIFQTNGKNILSSPLEITNGTPPINELSDNFINACIQSIQNKDIAAIIGICFNLAPYISNHFEQIDPTKFWEILILISPFINDRPAIYGYLEAAAELSIKSKNISNKFLSFLANPEAAQLNMMLKPLLLTAIFDYLPQFYIFNNTDYFLPLVINSFQIDDFLYRSNFLLILSKMNLNIEKITSTPNFSNIIWNFIFETSLSDINFPVLTSPLEKLRELVPDFFDLPNEVISKKLELIDESNIFGFIRLMPFLNSEYFQFVFKGMLDFIASNTTIQPRLNDAVLDSLICNFNDQSIKYMFSILSTNLVRNFDNVSIYVFSLYYQLFQEESDDAGLFLIKSINLAFSSIESNKSILCFAIAQIAEEYKTRSKLLRNSVVPSLINTFSLNDNESSRYASKAFIELCQTHTVSPSSFLDNYMQLFGEVLMNIPNYSIYCLKKYFKVLCKIVDMHGDDNFDANERNNKSLIIQFVIKYIFNNDLKLEVKAFFLKLCTSISKSFPDDFDDLIDISSSLAIGLLQSNISFSYPIAAEYILFSPNFKQINQIFPRLIEISSGKVTDDQKIIRVTSYYTAIISNTYDGLIFPQEIIMTQLSFQDDIYISRAITNLQFTFTQYNDEILSILLQKIIQISKVSTSSIVVDSTFVLLKQLIKEKTEFAFSFSSDLIISTIQGRISLLDHNFPFNYDHKKFKFYKCVSSYISHYKVQSHNIVLELIDWVPLASEDILPKIIKPLNRALTVMAIPSPGIPILWQYLLKRLSYDWHNTDLANYLLGCLVNMTIKYPTICNSKDLMQIMEYMWNPEDDEMKLILPQIFLDVWSNTDSPITFSIYHTFIDLILKEECNDWSFPLITKYLIKIVQNDDKDLDKDYFIDASRVFAHFILKSDEEKLELEFDDEIISEMNKALKFCSMKYEMVKDIILHEYRNYPGKINTLAQIFDLDT